MTPVKAPKKWLKWITSTLIVNDAPANHAQLTNRLNEILEKMNMEDSIYQNDHSGLSEKIQKGVITR